MTLSISKFKLLIVYLLFQSWSIAQIDQPKIYINEFMASNSNTILSDFNEYADWIEIYNGEDSTVSINGYFLTDDLSQPQKWQITDEITIRPGWTVLFWADSRDNGRHTNFNLSKSGEQIGIFSPDGEWIDSLTYGEQITDYSFGRYPDGADDWYIFDQPTPVTSNQYPGYKGVLSDPVFSHQSGFFDGGVALELIQNNPKDTIRYTTDGSLPGTQSAIYNHPISISSTTVIRAQTVREGYIPSQVITNSYFIDETTTLPVVSLATNPANLWDNEIGIYVEGTNGIAGYCTSELRNWNQPWERPISLEMFEADRNFAFKIDASVQIGGGCTRLYPQKTLAIYTRSEFGDSKINYKIFDDKPIEKYNNINLRNSGQDWWRAMFRDGLMHTIVKGKMDIEWQAYKPAILYINGDYWGIHGIREKHNEHYIAANHNIDPDEIDIVKGNAVVVQGTASHYENMIDFIKSNDLSDPAHFQWVTTQMDINQYLNYVISEIYFANVDWPGGNIKYWRQQGSGNKWRWILFDTDLGFGAHYRGQYDSNTLENATSVTGTYYANPPWSTFLLRNLLKNETFKNEFIQRAASHLNITFHPQHVLAITDSLKMNIEPEMPRHIQKWEKSTSFNDGWEYHVNVIREFAEKRPGYMLNHISTKFGLSGTALLSVSNSNPEAGNIIINNVEVTAGNFSGTYFKDIPVQCIAVPNNGFHFAGWQGVSDSENDTIQIVLSMDGSLQALFKTDETHEYRGLRINELLALNDNSNKDQFGESDDWIELYNDSQHEINIGGFYFTDDINQPDKWQVPLTYPDSTLIGPGDFLLLWADGQAQQGILHLDFKLGGDGEQIGISTQTDSGFDWIDSLTFPAQNTDISYGRYPDGMDRIDFLSTVSPGLPNVLTSLDDSKLYLPHETFLEQNFPNPFNPVTTIRYRLKTASKVRIDIYDITGQKVNTLVNTYQTAGFHTIQVNASEFSSGIYIYQLRTKNIIQNRKMIILQ